MILISGFQNSVMGSGLLHRDLRMEVFLRRELGLWVSLRKNNEALLIVDQLLESPVITYLDLDEGSVSAKSVLMNLDSDLKKGLRNSAQIDKIDGANYRLVCLLHKRDFIISLSSLGFRFEGDSQSVFDFLERINCAYLEAGDVIEVCWVWG